MPGSTASLVRTLGGSLTRCRPPQPFVWRVARTGTAKQGTRYCSTGSHSLASDKKAHNVNPAYRSLAVNKSSSTQTLPENDKPSLVDADNETMAERGWSAARVAPTPADLLFTKSASTNPCDLVLLWY